VIVAALHKNMTALDSVAHKTRRIKPLDDAWRIGGDMNAVFISVSEFGDACREYPIVFVDAGKNEAGKDLVAPVAVMGLRQGENLYSQNPWRADYRPALLRSYPFAMGRADESRVVLCMDESYAGWSESEGSPLFGDDAKLAPDMDALFKTLMSFEEDIQRTQAFGELLQDNGLLQPMRFDATLPDGQTLAVDGFLALDDKKFAELPDAKVSEFHRNGVLALLHMHSISMRNMRRLVEWRVGGQALQPAAAAPAVAANDA
jgi:hypothetical protein